MKALSYDSAHGKAHNQLAEIARYSAHGHFLADGGLHEFQGVYQYVRSMCALRPFRAKENLLALYERNRERLTNLEAQFGDARQTTNLLYPRYVRLHAILNTRISVETFDSLLQRVLVDFQMLIKEDMLPESVLCEMLVLVIASCEQCISRDFNKSEHSQDATPKPKLSLLTTKICVLLFRMFGIVSRWTSTHIQTLPYLPTLAVLCIWLNQSKCAYLISQSDHTHAVFFKTGLAQLINTLTQPSMMDEKKNRRESREQDVKYISDLRGFEPLQNVPQFRDAKSFHYDWQLNAIMHIAANILHFHDSVGRYSAYEQSKEAINQQEHLNITNSLQKKFRGAHNSNDGKAKRKKKKRKKKQPLFTSSSQFALESAQPAAVAGPPDNTLVTQFALEKPNLGKTRTTDPEVTRESTELSETDNKDTHGPDSLTSAVSEEQDDEIEDGDDASCSSEDCESVAEQELMQVQASALMSSDEESDGDATHRSRGHTNKNQDNLILFPAEETKRAEETGGMLTGIEIAAWVKKRAAKEEKQRLERCILSAFMLHTHCNIATLTKRRNTNATLPHEYTQLHHPYNV